MVCYTWTQNTQFICFTYISPHSPFLTDVEQMAIDWLTGNFYFVDDVDDRIFVCDKDGTTCVTLLDQELYNPKGIALDPTMGYEYESVQAHTSSMYTNS